MKFTEWLAVAAVPVAIGMGIHGVGNDDKMWAIITATLALARIVTSIFQAAGLVRD